MKTHQTSAQELHDLRAVIGRDLSDAALEQLSDDRRFATAYNAALQTAKMAIACAGYRVSGTGHHQTTFAVLTLVLGETAERQATFFDACRRKRNMVDYDLSGIISQAELAALIEEANQFFELVESWIKENHPQWTGD